MVLLVLTICSKVQRALRIHGAGVLSSFEGFFDGPVTHLSVLTLAPFFSLTSVRWHSAKEWFDADASPGNFRSFYCERHPPLGRFAEEFKDFFCRFAYFLLRSFQAGSKTPFRDCSPRELIAFAFPLAPRPSLSSSPIAQSRGSLDESPFSLSSCVHSLVLALEVSKPKPLAFFSISL